MMQRARQGRLPAVVHLLHVAQRRSGSSRSTSPSCRGPRPTSCARTSSSTPPTSSPSTCSTAARRRSRSARRSPRRCRPPGASTPATSSSSTSPCGRAARSTSTTRSTSTSRATGPPPRSPARTLAPYLTPLNGSAARTRRCASCATCTSTAATTTTILVLLQARRATTSSLVVCTLDPHGVREGVARPRPARTRAASGATRSRRTTWSPGTRGAWGQHPYVRLDPLRRSVAHIVHVRPGAV